MMYRVLLIFKFNSSMPFSNRQHEPVRTQSCLSSTCMGSSWFYKPPEQQFILQDTGWYTSLLRRRQSSHNLYVCLDVLGQATLCYWHTVPLKSKALKEFGMPYLNIWANYDHQSKEEVKLSNNPASNLQTFPFPSQPSRTSINMTCLWWGISRGSW